MYEYTLFIMTTNDLEEKKLQASLALNGIPGIQNFSSKVYKNDTSLHYRTYF